MVPYRIPLLCLLTVSVMAPSALESLSAQESRPKSRRSTPGTETADPPSSDESKDADNGGKKSRPLRRIKSTTAKRTKPGSESRSDRAKSKMVREISQALGLQKDGFFVFTVWDSSPAGGASAKPAGGPQRGTGAGRGQSKSAQPNPDPSNPGLAITTYEHKVMEGREAAATFIAEYVSEGMPRNAAGRVTVKRNTDSTDGYVDSPTRTPAPTRGWRFHQRFEKGVDGKAQAEELRDQLQLRQERAEKAQANPPKQEQSPNRFGRRLQ